ncbi:hypothetical protein HOY80DRAFT_764814 [Tuber brumale]|nr:hypothetical protein HOY80DRAFT_764814 [Tuber brumale]
MQILRVVREKAQYWTAVVGGGSGKTEYVAEIEDTGDLIRAREQGGKKGVIRELEQLLRESEAANSNQERELQDIKREKQDCVRGLEKRLKESDTTNSNLERKIWNIERENKDRIRGLEKRLKDFDAANSGLERNIQDLKHEKSTLSNEHQEALGQLRRAEDTGKKHCAKIKDISNRYDELRTQYNDLHAKNKGITTTNRKQEREIKVLRDNIAKITDELETRVEQLNKITGEIARQTQQVNTSAIRDDEYFAREFASLAKHIRNWSFTHLFPRSETFVPIAVTRDFQDAICRIASESNLPEIFKDRATSRRVVSGLLADKLREQLFDPLVLGLFPEPFLNFERMIETTGVQKSPWLSQTISLFVRSERFKQALNGKVCDLSKDLGEKLGELVDQGSDGSKASKRNQKLQAIVERASNLAVEVSQQPYWFCFATIPPGERFSQYAMEDVGTDMSLEEDDPGACDDDCKVSLSVFPCVYRRELVEGDNPPESVMIHRGWVTVETRNSHTDVEQTDENITNEEANGGTEPEVECPIGHSGGGGEMGAQGGEMEAQGGELGAQCGEESGNSPRPSMPGTENAVSMESTSPESQEV